MMPPPAIALPHIRAKRLRALGVTSAKRFAPAPELPTISEAGVPGYEGTNWSGFLAPASTPKEVVARLYQEISAILNTQETRERLAAEGYDVIASTPEQFGAFIQSEILKWGKVVKTAGIQLE